LEASRRNGTKAGSVEKPVMVIAFYECILSTDKTEGTDEMNSESMNQEHWRREQHIKWSLIGNTQLAKTLQSG
jgi:hypothetical protein